MSESDDGGPAFPRRLPDIKVPPDEAVEIIMRHSGMSLRDYFAAEALQQAIEYETSEFGSYRHFCDESADIVARHAYQMADAMLKARQS